MAAPTKVLIPKLGIQAHFHPRHSMKKGHPQRRFGRGGKLAVTVPPEVDWAKSLSFPMDGNDKYGDCMYAAACHADNTFTGNAGTESRFSETTIVRDYLKLAGGDNGLDEGTLIGEWKQGLASTPAAIIDDALDIDTTDAALVQQAIYLFGGVLFMLDVPDKWLDETETGAVWDAPATADQSNGHGVWWNGYDSAGRYKLQTWGTYVWITPAGVNDCDPSGFVVFSPRWFNAQGYAPNGYHYTELAAEWVARGGNPVPASPFPAPSPTPSPINPPSPQEYIVTGVASGTISIPATSPLGRPVTVSVSLPVTGTASPAASQRRRRAERINWLALAADVKQFAVDAGLAYEDALKILGDLGVTLGA